MARKPLETKVSCCVRERKIWKRGKLELGTKNIREIPWPFQEGWILISLLKFDCHFWYYSNCISSSWLLVCPSPDLWPSWQGVYFPPKSVWNNFRLLIKSFPSLLFLKYRCWPKKLKPECHLGGNPPGASAVCRLMRRPPRKTCLCHPPLVAFLMMFGHLLKLSMPLDPMLQLFSSILSMVSQGTFQRPSL